MLRISAALTLVALSADAVHAQAVTYACVEERSVGWEPREGQEDAVGRFAPSTAAKLMKFSPTEIVNGKVKRLGEVAVTEDGKTYTYSSNECANVLSYVVSDRAFGANNNLDYYLELCADRFSADNNLRTVGFGVDTIRYYFTDDPMTLASPIRYSMSMQVGIAWAYASQGTCALIE